MLTKRKSITFLCGILAALMFAILLAGCAAPTETQTEIACAVTEPAYLKPPEDPAVQGVPEFSYYFVNEEKSIWASAFDLGDEEAFWHAGEDAEQKVGWFRPEGAELEVTGRRLDAESPPLEAHLPCCYPTRFQASGLLFPTAGCWEVTAKAAGSVLTFTVRIWP